MQDNNNQEKLTSDENGDIKIKKRNRIILITIITLILTAIIVVVIVLAIKKDKNSPEEQEESDSPKSNPDPQQVPNNYIDLEDNEGDLEKVYSKMGEYQTNKENIKFEENQKYNFMMFYPKNESNSNEDIKYPVIIFFNNLNRTYEINEPIFNHLASYGFVIITDDNKNSTNGESIKTIIEKINDLNNNQSFILYKKLDINNIGISCHDQSIISLLKITNDINLRDKIKSVFCAAPLPQNDIILKKYYYFYKNMTFKNIFFISPLNDPIFTDTKYYKDIIMIIPRNTNYNKILIAQRNHTTRDNILWKSDAYHTAWYLSTLKNDETANEIFKENVGEIFNNTKVWSKVTIRSETQIMEGEGAIYITNNFRQYVTNEEGLEKKYGEKGEKQYSTYEIFCDPNLDSCSKNQIFNYIIYYPSELIHNNKKYPLIVFSNALNFGYYYITPLLEHLASWGFVLIANDEGKSYLSKGIVESLKYMIKFNKDNESIFYNKIDLDNIGFSGHSAGASGVLYYTNLEHQNELQNLTIKSLYPSCINDLKTINTYFKINLNFTKVNIPYIFLTSSEQEGTTVLPTENFTKYYLNIFTNTTYQFIARKKLTTHHNFYWNSVGYLTAWFLYTLTNDENAKQIFEPKPDDIACPGVNKNGICKNQLWYDIVYSNNTN